MKFNTIRDAAATIAIAVLAIIAFAVTTGAYGQEVGQHPAVFAPRALPAVDSSTFIVGHPASPTVRGGHANFAHPAVLVAQARTGQLDSNTFLVQPPASVIWTLGPRIDTPVAQR